MSELTFRMAEERDVPLILSFIRDLADYEQMLDQVVATEELLREWLFEKKKAEVCAALFCGYFCFCAFLGPGGGGWRRPFKRIGAFKRSFRRMGSRFWQKGTLWGWKKRKHGM